MPLKEIEEFVRTIEQLRAESQASANRRSAKKPTESVPDPHLDEPSAAEARFQQLAQTVAAAGKVPVDMVAPLLASLGRGSAKPEPQVGERTKWQRITLAEGIELHVSEGHSGKRDAAVKRLIDSATELLADEPS